MAGWELLRRYRGEFWAYVGEALKDRLSQTRRMCLSGSMLQISNPDLSLTCAQPGVRTVHFLSAVCRSGPGAPSAWRRFAVLPTTCCAFSLRAGVAGSSTAFIDLRRAPVGPCDSSPGRSNAARRALGHDEDTQVAILVMAEEVEHSAPRFFLRCAGPVKPGAYPAIKLWFLPHPVRWSVCGITRALPVGWATA